MRFYTRLVEIESVYLELEKIDLTPKHKNLLADLLDSLIHHTILELVLSQLSNDDKLVFLNHLKTKDEAKIWEFLNMKIDKIEDKIKTSIEDLRLELHKDINDAHRKVSNQ